MDLTAILAPIAEPLARVDAAMLAACETSVPTITQVVQYIIAGGGKRLRPALTLLCAHLTGYRGDAGPRIGAALEMIHTASLLHDDVIDHATTRRSRASVNAAWGNQVSVLVGDFFWCRACQLIIRHGSPAMLHAITEAIAATTEGEILELIRSHDVGITETEYLTILTQKTARLLGVSCEAGAMLADADSDTRRRLADYGIALGVAFQLTDDLLDYSAATEFGKTLGTDLREGRLTMPLIRLLACATPAENARIREVIAGEQQNPATLEMIVTLCAQYRCLEHTAALANTHAKLAVQQIADLPPAIDPSALHQLARYAVTRTT